MYLQGNINIHSWQTVDGINEAVTVYYAECRIIVPGGNQLSIRRLSLYDRSRSMWCFWVTKKINLIGSPGRARTADLVINSHPLYRLSYRGIIGWNNSVTLSTASYNSVFIILMTFLLQPWLPCPDEAAGGPESVLQCAQPVQSTSAGLVRTWLPQCGDRLPLF